MRRTGLMFYEFEPSEVAEELAEKFGYRTYMVERYLRMFGESETLDLLKANDETAPTTIRINTIKAESTDFLNTLKQKGYPFKQMSRIANAYELDAEAFRYKDVERYSKQNRPPRKHRKRVKMEFYSSKVRETEETDYTRSSKELSKLEWGRRDSRKKKEQKEAVKKKKINDSKRAKERVKTATLGSVDEYLMGNYYIQGYASMLPPVYLDVSSEDTVVDMCAAPGGKTTHLAQLMNNVGQLVAVEMDRERMKSLNYNLRRCGVQNTVVLNIDATKISKYDIYPDKILLDAPCSGEGVIREDPKRKTSKTPGDIKYMMRTQKRLLETAVRSVKPGGYIMYSTCSIAPEENEFVIQAALDNHDNLSIVPVNDNYGLPGFNRIFGVDLDLELLNARRYYPHVHDTEGFFYCLLQKT